MRLLDRYLLRELMIPLGFCLGGFFIFWVGFDLLTNLTDFRDHRLSTADVFEFYGYRTPELLNTIVPIALLLALLYTLTYLARHHELTAIRAAGISVWRLTLPFVGVGLVLSLLLFSLHEWICPDSLDRADRVMERYSGKTDDTGWKSRLSFKNQAAGRF